MKISSKELLQDLLEQTRININTVKRFQELKEEELNWKSDSKSWSILQCIEHLNRYGDFYINEIRQKMYKSNIPMDEYFISSWLGNYFANMLAPREKLNKMKTFNSMNPDQSELDHDVLTKFISQQHEIIDLLDKARNVNLSKIKTGITISKMIKLRLGDTFRVVINHNDRHVLQAEKALNNQKKSRIS